MLGQTTQDEDVDDNTTHFLTVGGFKVNNFLKMQVNQEDDVKAVRENIDPDEHTSPSIPDLDLELHKVQPLNGQTEEEFRSTVLTLASNFKNQGPEIIYTLPDENCSAWVNTLFKVAGISDEDRDELGEFYGIDWGEEDLIPESFFS